MSAPNATALLEKYPPEFLNQYNGRTLINVCIAFIILDTIFVALRFVSRRMSRTPWGWDDYLVLPGLVFCYSCCAQSIAMVNYGGVGYHLPRVEIDEPQVLTTWFKFALTAPIIYSFAVLFPKLAILSIYLRVFIEKMFRMACYVLILVLIGTSIGVSIASLVQCRPLAYFWDKSIEGGKCFFDSNPFFRWASFPNIVTDLIMLILPLPYIWRLHTSYNVKVGLSATFATGSVGLITSIVRFTIFWGTNAITDATWASVKLMGLTCVEPSMYLIAACLPAYRPLVIWVRRALGFSSGENATTMARSRGLPSRKLSSGRGAGDSKVTHRSTNSNERGSEEIGIVAYEEDYKGLAARDFHRLESKDSGTNRNMDVGLEIKDLGLAMDQPAGSNMLNSKGRASWDAERRVEAEAEATAAAAAGHQGQILVRNDFIVGRTPSRY